MIYTRKIEGVMFEVDDRRYIAILEGGVNYTTYQVKDLKEVTK